MLVPIAMPKLGMTMREGTVRDWPVPIGARVEKGQVVVVIESEKAEVDIESTASGFVRHVYVDVDETVPCGTLLGALSETADEAFDAEGFAREQPAPEPAPASELRTPPISSSTDRSGPRRSPAAEGRRPVAPAARALARRLGLDAADVPGSGPGGRVTREDVEAWSARKAALTSVADDVALEVLSEGSGDPVVLLPGFGMDVSSFAFQTPVLSATHRVIGVNPRGVGLSDAPECSVYDLAGAAQDVASLVEEPAHVVGASLGTGVAIELALTHPDRVRSLVLLTPLLESTGRLQAVIEAWCRIAATADADTLASALLPWLFSGRFLFDVRLRERTRRGLAASLARVPASTLERTAAGLQAWSGTRWDQLGELRVPTLVLVAGGDLLTPDGEAIARSIPGARAVVIPEAGHALAVEAAEAVNAAIQQHLAGS
jgi:pimeloyl-ACP methyl ester carboxylesterase